MLPLVAGLVVLLAQPVGAAILGSLAGLTPEERSGLRGVALGAAGGYAGAIVAMIAAGMCVRGLFGRCGSRPEPKDFVRGVIGIALAAPVVLFVGQVALAVAAGLSRLAGRPGPEANAHATLRLLMQEQGQWSVWWWVLVAAVVVGAPVVEEVVYRGFFQTACRSATGSRRWAVLSASAVFTLMHAGVAEVHALAVLFTLSVAFGVAFERTGRLWVPITMHALFNAGNLVGALAAGAGNG